MSADRWGTCPHCGLQDALREDFEFFWREGVLHVRYAAHCRGDLEKKDGCGFTFDFHDEKRPTP